MVVMDDVSEEYVSLFNLIRDNPDLLSEEHLGVRDFLSDKIRQCLQQLHQAGFVHGDIRDTNVMVKTLKQGGFNDPPFLVVDYDSCGKIKQVRYPLNLNTTSVQRPEGATGGAVIEVEHDLEMLDHIWDS
jgi:RIO-like serine/threonine protein kinase